MSRQIMGWIVALVLAAGTAHAATLGIPGPHTTLSGIGVISGWKCDAGELTAHFDGGDPIPLVYGSERKDVLNAGACDHANVGFVSIMNWGNLGDGQHTAVVYDDGVEFDRSTFNVVTTGEAFLEGAAGQCTIDDFPVSGADARFVWNQSTQHLEMVEVWEPPPVQDRPDLAQTIPSPQWMTAAWWHWEEGQASLEIDFTIHTNVADWSDRNGLYLILAGGAKIGDTLFYFGLQTDVARPGVGRAGKGVIFSRWETRDLSNARLAPNGFAESAGHEGDFIGVRRPYDWSAGRYRARLARYDSDSQGDWFGLWITDKDHGRTTWIGALRFPHAAGISPAFSSVIEVYGVPIRPIDIPEWYVSITAPLGGLDAELPTHVNTSYHDSVPNTEIWYQADENAVHMRVGGTTQRQTLHAGPHNRYQLPAVE